MYPATLITLIVQGCNMGSRMIATLFAIQLGANPFLVGLLISAYSVLPLLLSVYSGRASDRYGARYPMLAGALASAVGTLLPALVPSLGILYLSAVLVGTGFIFFNVSVQNLAGSLGPPEQRTRNFSTLALGYASGHLVGPLVAGLSIDHLGHSAAYACLTALGLVPVLLVACNRRLDTPARASRERHSTFDLLRVPALRRVIIVSGLTATGWDLYLFYVPIYGHGIGLSATTIGTILGAFAVATFILRIVLPVLTRRFGLERVLATALALSAIMFLPFPFIEFVPALLMLSFAMGLAMGCGQPLTLNLAYNRAPPGRSGEVAGLRLTVNNITHLGLPVVAGAMGAAFGAITVFWIAAGILGACSYLTRRFG
jgi:predicted MFS family arabinose efflux permease